MKFFFLDSFMALALLFFLGCLKADFNNGHQTQYDEVYLTFNHAYQEIDGSNYEVKRPVVILFLLDVTGSMEEYINTVKNNVTELVNKLTNKNFSVKIGFISYKDEIIGKYKITTDTNTFIKKVGALSVDGGEDNPEAGLMAVVKGVDMLLDPDLKPYLKTMVLVSDDLSHNDSSKFSIPKNTDCHPKRNCTIASTVEKLNSIDSQEQEKYKLFYSVPIQAGCSCSSYISPKKQLDDILEKSLTSVSDNSSKGGYLGWEFSSDSLLNTLPNMIEQSSEPKLLCLVDKINFNIDGTKITYDTSFEQEYKHYISEEKSQMIIKDKNVISAVRSVQTQNRTVTVSQSCFDMVDAEAGDFTKPLTTNTSNVEYRLEYKKNQSNK